MFDKKTIIKNLEKPVQKYRFVIQAVFALLCIWIGIEFFMFIKYLETGEAAGSAHRPAGVEGFLPISALMSIYNFFITGEIHPVHPAGFFILLAIVVVSFLIGKSFCSWICPIGFLSELVGDFGDKIYKKIFKRRVKLPKLLDYPLRSLKYLLLGFFVYAIFFSMTATALQFFLNSSYNKVADIKMWYFFADISRFSLIVIALLFVLSIFIRNFWCRYLCPYGALLGIISFLSPTKIKREPKSCIDCNLCAKACPSFIKVDKVITVRSDECTMCLSCVDACPVADTLEVKTKIIERKISKKYIVYAIAGIYVIITGIGILSGNWNNNISKEEYLILHKNIDKLGHPTSTQDIKELNRVSETGAEDGAKKFHKE
ncbi:MAG: 4Fe-4S binding protein [Melioribacteraceae bacterium]|nr:4Fe-4S binding protein [Melioribacteraceae bacterium]